VETNEFMGVTVNSSLNQCPYNTQTIPNLFLAEETCSIVSQEANSAIFIPEEGILTNAALANRPFCAYGEGMNFLYE
jgi:hypothetical protein